MPVIHFHWKVLWSPHFPISISQYNFLSFFSNMTHLSNVRSQRSSSTVIYLYLCNIFLLILPLLWIKLGFPGGAMEKNPLADIGDKERLFNLWVRKIGKRKWQPTPVCLPGKSHGQRSLAGYSPWCHKESDPTERLSTVIEVIDILFGMGSTLKNYRCYFHRAFPFVMP